MTVAHIARTHIATRWRATVCALVILKWALSPVTTIGMATVNRANWASPLLGALTALTALAAACQGGQTYDDGSEALGKSDVVSPTETTPPDSGISSSDISSSSTVAPTLREGGEARGEHADTELFPDAATAMVDEAGVSIPSAETPVRPPEPTNGLALDPQDTVDSGSQTPAQDAAALGCLDDAECPWSEVAKLPAPTSRLAATTYANKLYVFGGAATADVAQPDQGNYNLSFVYDPANDAWQSLSPLPVGAFGLDVHAVGDTLYAFLAYGDGGFVQDVFAYDPVNDVWTERASRPTQRYTFSTAVVGTKVLVIGGVGPSQGEPTAPDWVHQNDIEVYDTETDSWSTIGTLPHGISTAASCNIDNTVYVFGGDVNATAVYDAQADSWFLASAPPLPRADHECVRLGDVFVLLGGRSTMGEALDAVEQYDPATDTWTELELLPKARYWFAAQPLGGNAFVVGGESDYIELDSMLKFTP